MRLFSCLLVGTLIGWGLSFADDNDVFDRALKEAQRMHSQQQGLPNIPMNKAPEGASLDPEQIMRQYQSLGKSQKPNEDLIIFVSSSMPMSALEKLGRQAKKAGAVLVIRGLVGELDKNGWNETMEFMRPVAKTGVSIQIHPELFKQYNVKVVPTFLLATNGVVQGCNDDMCDANAIRAEGDASLGYVLEYWYKKYDADQKISGLIASKINKLSQDK